MFRKVVVGAAALSLVSAAAARAQGADDFASLLAVFQEHFGQSMGEAVVGGQSVFVTAKGVAKLAAPIPRNYDVTVEGQAATAVQAARLRDDKIDRLRAVAKRFSATMTLGEPAYVAAARFPVLPRPAGSAAAPPLSLPAAPSSAPASSMLTARVAVHFTRPAEASMPAFLDALREAGVDTLPDTNVASNPLLQLTQTLGLGGGAAAAAQIDEETWNKASTAAVQAARAQAETLAVAAGRHVGQMRQVILLTRSAQGGEASVTVAARFGFEPVK